MGRRRSEGPNCEVAATARLEIEGELWQQGHRVPTRDHLGERAEAGSPEVSELCRTLGATDGEGLIAQAVPVVEQQHLLAVQILQSQALLAHEGVIRRHHREEVIAE